MTSGSKSSLADRLWALIVSSGKEHFSESELERAASEFERAPCASGTSQRIVVRWRHLSLAVRLCDDDSFNALQCKLWLCLHSLSRAAASLSRSAEQLADCADMRAFLASADDADVCVINATGGLVGGLSVVADEMSPLQVHVQLVDELSATGFHYRWQMVESALSETNAADDDDVAATAAAAADESTATPRSAGADSAAPALLDRGISSRLLEQTPGAAAAADERRKKLRKRRVRKNTSSKLPTVVGAAAPAPATQQSMALNRRGVIDELLATEREFVSDLFMLNAHFASPLASDKATGRRKVGKAIFQNVGDLLALHVALLVRLQRGVQVAPPAVAAAFSAWLAACDVGEPHASYAGGFQRATALLEAARAQPVDASVVAARSADEPTTLPPTLFTAGGTVCSFAGRAVSVSNNSVALLPRESQLFDSKTLVGLSAYVRLCEAATLMRKETLESFLIRPIQRLMRYPLLLKSLRDATTQEPEFGKLCVVIERLEDIIETVNRTKAQRESEDTLVELSKTVVGLEKHKPEGFLCKGVFTDVNDTRQQQQLWLLFENVLLRCAPNTVGGKPPPQQQQQQQQQWKVFDALLTPRLWASADHADALASIQSGGDEPLSPVERRTQVRNAGILVFGEPSGDVDADADFDMPPLSPTSASSHVSAVDSSSSPASPASPRAFAPPTTAAPPTPTSTSVVVDTFGEKIVQTGRKLVVRARTPMDARQWLRTLESATRRLARSVPAARRAEFFAAVCDGDLASVRRALKKTPALWNATLDETGGTAMHALCDVSEPRDEQLAVARFLIRSNATLLQPDLNDSIPLRSALVRGSAELVRLLLPLSWMSLDARRFACRQLPQAADDEQPLSRDCLHFGATTLHLLVLGGDEFRRLLSATLLGENARTLVLSLDGSGRAAMSLAIAMRDARAVRLLLRARAPCHGTDYIGCELGDGATLGAERAALVFAPRASDATTLKSVASSDASSDVADAPPSEPSSPGGGASSSAAATTLEEGSAARFAEQLGELEIAHSIFRAAQFFKGKPSDPATAALSSIVSPRGDASPATRLKAAASARSSSHVKRREEHDVPRSTRTSVGTTPTPLRLSGKGTGNARSALAASGDSATSGGGGGTTLEDL